MKKQLTVALGLAVLATPAFASKARLQALGEDSNGSFYISDNRNIFLNAAQVNNHKDLVTFETGSATGEASSLASGDSAASPRPEGGVFFSQGNMVYGVHLGSENNTSNVMRAWSGTASEQNNIDVFVGGDAGLKWGANLTYSGTSESKDATGGVVSQGDQAIRTRLGVISGDLEAFANLSLKNVAESQNDAGETTELEGKLGTQLGVIYNLNAYRLYAEYQGIKAEDKTANNDASIGLWRVGAGRTEKLNDRANLFTKLEVSRRTLNFDGTVGGAFSTGGKDVVTTNLPLTVGLEYDATSWLVFRASVAQSLYSDVSRSSSSNRNLSNTTIVNAGAGLKFGEFSVDGVIGNYDPAAPVDGVATVPAVNAEGTTGSLRTDNLMSRVSMTYRF